ncbi:MAG: D-alanyl-D-alanine carboxypeptidase/D-alanyl-D-alanine-endopeptidase [Ignavibacteria bacterium]|nr:D-alanyl-D-alanine carboxypeptidase/D-alanyl-D-alanine-endopeptidase [Ignavibacteria bacterium]
MKTYKSAILSILTFTLSCVVLSSSSVTAQSDIHNTIKLRLDSLAHIPFWDTVSCGIRVFDATEGKLVYENNARKLMHPASNMKILTTMTALHYLGPEYTYRTDILRKGMRTDKTVQGDLVVRGSGDPDFNEADLDSLLQILQHDGIKEFTGNLIADVSLFDSVRWGKGWMWDDETGSDAPWLTPLNIAKNCVKVTYVKLPARQPEISIVPNYSSCVIFNEVVLDTVRKISVSINRDGNDMIHNIFHISGHVNDNDTISITEELSIVHPALRFLELVRSKLSNLGIRILGKDSVSYGKVETTALLCEKSRNLGEIVIPLNKESDNLSAEMVLRSIPAARGKLHITAADGLRFIDSLISYYGMNPGNYRLVDGSGASHYNLISAELLGRLLENCFYQDRKVYELLRTSFPWGGIDGTLRKRMKQAPLLGNVYAKTGTISGVSSLSGYLHTPNNKIYVFSIVMQNHFGKLYRCHELQAEFLRIISDAE